MEPHTVSLARQMQAYTREERQKMMKAAADNLADYYRTDSEMQEWQALDADDFCDDGNHSA